MDHGVKVGQHVSDEKDQSPSANVEPLLIGLVEAGAAMAISRTATYKLLREGRFPLPVLKVGDRYRVSRKALTDFVARGE